MINTMLETVDRIILEKDGDKIETCTIRLEPDFDIEEFLRSESYACLDTIGLYEYLLERNSKVINQLEVHKRIISVEIGDDAYGNLKESLDGYNNMLDNEIDDLRDSYDLINSFTDALQEVECNI